MSLARAVEEAELWPISVDWDLACERAPTRQGLAYWQALCAGRLMPERRELEPRAMVRFLAHVNLVEVSLAGAAGWNYRVTLQGGHSREVLGNVTGRNLGAIFPKALSACWRGCFDLPRARRAPVRFVTRTNARGKSPLACEAVLAPLGGPLGVDALFWVFAAWPETRTIGCSQPAAASR